jgi:hypothetical protein
LNQANANADKLERQSEASAGKEQAIRDEIELVRGRYNVAVDARTEAQQGIAHFNSLAAAEAKAQAQAKVRVEIAGRRSTKASGRKETAEKAITKAQAKQRTLEVDQSNLKDNISRINTKITGLNN